MVRQLLRNGQITLPKDAVRQLHLKAKDLLEIRVDRFGIHLRPLPVQELSREEYAKLAKKLDALKARSRAKAYTSTEDARRHLDRMMRPE